MNESTNKLSIIEDIYKNKTNDYTGLVKLFKYYLKEQKRNIIMAAIYMAITAITTSLSAWLTKPVLDDIFLKKDMTMLIIIPVIIVVVTLIKGIATFYKTTIMRLVGQYIVTHIQLDLYAHVIKSDIEFFHHYQSGNLMSRFINEVNLLRRCVGDMLDNIICDGFTIIGLIGIMFYQSTNLSIIALVVFSLAFRPITSIGKKIKKITDTMQNEMTGFATQLEETFQNINIIKSYCREDYEILRANKTMKKLSELFKKFASASAISSPVMEVMGGVVIAIVIWYEGYNIIRGVTTPGAFFAFMTALLMLYGPLKSIAGFNNSLYVALALSDRLFQILEAKPAIRDQDTAHDDIRLNKYDIEFKDVSFHYPNGQKVLEHLSMQIHEHTTIALVGASGQGKTTILNLIERFYDPTDGSILIGGYHIKDMRLANLRNNIAMVSQDIMLFDDNVMENIRYGRLDATDEEIIEAAKLAAAHEFIIGLSEEYKTKIGQKGTKLSGGQKQRISIARAILKNAPILLLDEATSALDNISEKQIQCALENLKKGRTTIIIAHRLSTIENADKIYLISKGQIVEKGTHAELLKLNGLYKIFYSDYKNDYRKIGKNTYLI